MKFFYTQMHCIRAGIDAKVRRTDLDQQARHLPVIFENLNFENYFERNCDCPEQN